jgi:hypothetical protein
MKFQKFSKIEFWSVFGKTHANLGWGMEEEEVTGFTSKLQ